MHELSICYSIVEAAAETARRAGATRVESVKLRIGALAGVQAEPLLFSYELAAEGTALAGSTLEIEHLPVVIFCPSCGETRELPGIQSFRCPVCQTPSGDIRQGKELEIESILCQ